jgi:hypothetical protein
MGERVTGCHPLVPERQTRQKTLMSGSINGCISIVIKGFLDSVTKYKIRVTNNKCINK